MNDFDSYRTDYQLVPLSQASVVLKGQGGAGKAQDIINHVVIIPLTTGAGDVSLADGDGADMTIFKSGTLADLSPIFIPLHARSVNGAWKLTTGDHVQVFVSGRFQ